MGKTAVVNVVNADWIVEVFITGEEGSRGDRLQVLYQVDNQTPGSDHEGGQFRVFTE